MSLTNNLNTLSDLVVGDRTYSIYSLAELESHYGVSISKLPFSIRILLENVLRNLDGKTVTEQHVESLAKWDPSNAEPKEIPYKPARVILQDFTGVPCVVDLAAMRSVVEKKGADPSLVNPIVPVDLVIDHSVQVDYFASGDAFGRNVEVEYERNRERYTFLKWAQGSFDNFRVVPPGTGIVHQVNLECLASVVVSKESGSDLVAYPDTLVGTDSHTTMINGLSVMGWGVGGIEAEACMLGQPLYMLIPDVIGFRLTGSLSEGVTATDLVLRVTEMLRKKGVVSKFVEFFGPGVSNLALSDQATIANMAPEYGATMGFFPVDAETLRYLAATGREDAATLVEAYTKEQKMFRTDDAEDPVYTDTLELDISTVEPSLAGPSRPQDRISLGDMKNSYNESLKARGAMANGSLPSEAANGISDGSVVIAAITSCTNTSNPSVMIGAGLFAKRAVEKGLSVSPYVKTSLAPGSRVVTDYLDAAGLTPYLEKLGFDLVGYGCTTCIGNSGPLPDEVDAAIRENDLTCAAVLSGNRNFEGRVHPLVKFAYLASPPLVVAFAIAGRVGVDLYSEPLGVGSDGEQVFLRDIWPTQQEIIDTVSESITPEIFNNQYSKVFEGDDTWKSLAAPHSDIYEWDADSTYIQEPPFFDDFPLEPEDPSDIENAHVLALLGDSITTDHISPAGSIPKDGPAGGYLISKGVSPKSFNSFGSRRGNHEVMIRGSFANIRIKNRMVGGKEGGWTVHVPTGEEMSIYDASSKYMSEDVDLVVVGGKEYGTGSSRDWAAKGTALLGAKCVIAESFERIHRSNLVGMGVLPLQFEEGQSAQSLGITGFETFSVSGVSENLYPGKQMTVTITDRDGKQREFHATCRLDTPVEVEYYRNGGILQTVLRQMISQ
ncbi:MAG: aconitate hydratase AcnA [Candidatus Dadabacteria bacterium]|nr:aconitate hydratase AcnA [Candidatus Dadabacteria bacterium]